MSVKDAASGHDEFLLAQLASLPSLPAIQRLSPTVIRILGGNPGKFTLQGTNTYLLGTGPGRLLVDTGQGTPVWSQSLQTVLADEKATVTKALCTHWHHDHVGGISDLLKFSPSTSVYKNTPDEGQLDIKDGQQFSVQGATVRALYTPGHAEDHMSFVLVEENAILTGDNVLGHGTTVFEDLGKYISSLKLMAAQGTGRAYPGHGEFIEDGKGKIEEYLIHRQRREDQIVKVLKDDLEKWKAVGGVLGMGSMDIVKIIYEGYSEGLYKAAEQGVLQVLAKLEGEGRVGKDEEERWFLKVPGKTGAGL